jgi:ComF family protein
MLRQTDNKWLNITQKCVICMLNTTKDSSVCTECEKDLPWANDVCFQCGLPLTTNTSGYRCGQCLQHPPPFTNTTAAFFYLFPINTIMPRLKNSHGLHHHYWLTDSLIKQIKSRHQALPDALLPVPVHITRRVTRGYNQSDWICQQLSQSLHIPADYTSLTKIKASAAQALLDSFNRRRNLQGHFSYQGPHYQHVALIDDVMTTGTTARVIADTLLAYGIKQVDIWVLARTPEPDFV